MTTHISQFPSALLITALICMKGLCCTLTCARACPRPDCCDSGSKRFYFLVIHGSADRCGGGDATIMTRWWTEQTEPGVYKYEWPRVQT